MDLIVWSVRTLCLFSMVVYTCSEQFTSTGYTWTIPDVSYPDPIFVYNIQPTTTLIASKKFPVEKHFIQTQDGYILALHRIPPKDPPKRPPILMVHGFTMASDMWMIRNDSSLDLPFLLSKQGFDVWLGNFRGNVYSRHHATLNPDEDVEFWDFSIDDYGSQDLPAMIELVRHKSGHDRIIYIGYSIGGGSSYIMADTQPEYTQHILLNILLAPFVFPPQEGKSVFFKHFKFLINNRLNTYLSYNLKESHEFSSRTNDTVEMYYWACSIWYLPGVRSMCTIFLQELGGYSGCKNLSNKSMVLKSLCYTSGGTSTKAVYHMWHMYDSRRFLQYSSLPDPRHQSSNDSSVHRKHLDSDKSKPTDPNSDSSDKQDPKSDGPSGSYLLSLFAWNWWGNSKSESSSKDNPVTNQPEVNPDSEDTAASNPVAPASMPKLDDPRGTIKSLVESGDIASRGENLVKSTGLSDNIESWVDQPKPSDNIQKPSDNIESWVYQPKPSNNIDSWVDQTKPSDNIPKPSDNIESWVDHPKPSNNIDSWVERPKPSDNIPKPSDNIESWVENPKPENNIESWVDHPKSSVNIPKPSNNIDSWVDQPKPENNIESWVDYPKPIEPKAHHSYLDYLNPWAYFNSNSESSSQGNPVANDLIGNSESLKEDKPNSNEPIANGESLDKSDSKPNKPVSNKDSLDRENLKSNKPVGNIESPEKDDLKPNGSICYSEPLDKEDPKPNEPNTNNNSLDKQDSKGNGPIAERELSDRADSKTNDPIASNNIDSWLDQPEPENNIESWVDYPKPIEPSGKDNLRTHSYLDYFNPWFWLSPSKDNSGSNDNSDTSETLGEANTKLNDPIVKSESLPQDDFKQNGSKSSLEQDNPALNDLGGNGEILGEVNPHSNGLDANSKSSVKDDLNPLEDPISNTGTSYKDIPNLNEQPTDGGSDAKDDSPEPSSNSESSSKDIQKSKEQGDNWSLLDYLYPWRWLYGNVVSSSKDNLKSEDPCNDYDVSAEDVPILDELSAFAERVSKELTESNGDSNSLNEENTKLDEPKLDEPKDKIESLKNEKTNLDEAKGIIEHLDSENNKLHETKGIIEPLGMLDESKRKIEPLKNENTKLDEAKGTIEHLGNEKTNMDGVKGRIEPLGNENTKLYGVKGRIEPLGNENTRLDGFRVILEPLGNENSKLDAVKGRIEPLGNENTRLDGFKVIIEPLGNKNTKLDGVKGRIEPLGNENTKLDAVRGIIEPLGNENTKLDAVRGIIEPLGNENSRLDGAKGIIEHSSKDNLNPDESNGKTKYLGTRTLSRSLTKPILHSHELREFDVTKMTIPTIIFYARDDRLVGKQSMEKLEKLTPNIVKINQITHDYFVHIDFYINENINHILHNDLLYQLNEYLSKSEAGPHLTEGFDKSN